MGFLAQAILFSLLLGLYELVRWGVSLVRKGSFRTTKSKRLAIWRLDKRTERARLIVETLEEKVRHKGNNRLFNRVNGEKRSRTTFRTSTSTIRFFVFFLLFPLAQAGPKALPQGDSAAVAMMAVAMTTTTEVAGASLMGGAKLKMPNCRKFWESPPPPQRQAKREMHNYRNSGRVRRRGK